MSQILLIKLWCNLIIYLKHCAKVLSQSRLYRLLTQNLSLHIFTHWPRFHSCSVLILYLMIQRLLTSEPVSCTYNTQLSHCEMVSLGSLLPAARHKHTSVVSISLVQSKISHFDIKIFGGEKSDFQAAGRVSSWCAVCRDDGRGHPDAAGSGQYAERHGRGSVLFGLWSVVLQIFMQLWTLKKNHRIFFHRVVPPGNRLSANGFIFQHSDDSNTGPIQ